MKKHGQNTRRLMAKFLFRRFCFSPWTWAAAALHQPSVGIPAALAPCLPPQSADRLLIPLWR